MLAADLYEPAKIGLGVFSLKRAKPGRVETASRSIEQLITLAIFHFFPCSGAFEAMCGYRGAV